MRRGGDVILFGLKTGDAVIENFDRLIVDGISLHCVIGRRIFETWHITRHLLESRDPNIHDLIWEVILDRGKGTIVPFQSFAEDDFAQRIQAYPKSHSEVLNVGGGHVQPATLQGPSCHAHQDRPTRSHQKKSAL